LTIPDSTTSAEARAFLRLTPRVFAPAVDDDTLSRWTKEMAQTGQASSPTVPIDPNDTERSALVATIGAVLPSDLAAEAGSYPATLGTAALHQIPLVSVTVDGKTRYANPLFAEATFGVSLTQNDPVPGPDASPAPTVTVEILVSTTADPTNRISVAKGSYGADELAGRQILVQFAPAADVDTFAKLRIRDIRTFKPVLSVRGRDVDPDGQRLRRSIPTQPRAWRRSRWTSGPGRSPPCVSSSRRWTPAVNP